MRYPIIVLIQDLNAAISAEEKIEHIWTTKLHSPAEELIEYAFKHNIIREPEEVLYLTMNCKGADKIIKRVCERNLERIVEKKRQNEEHLCNRLVGMRLNAEGITKADIWAMQNGLW